MKDIVCKFGGTSLATAENIKNICKIIKKKRRHFVVVSAPGKRNKNDEKITDILIDIYSKAKDNKPYQNELSVCFDRFRGIAKGLNVDVDLEVIFYKISEYLANKPHYDYVISRGEYINAIIISKFIGYDFLDASEFILFENGEVNIEKSRTELLSKIESGKSYVIPGFYGIDENGNIKTFSRGGSDLTGAILSVLLGSRVYENYTDVDGIMTIDPKLSNKAKVVARLSYSEIRCLSFSGAGVLHPDCANFLKKNNITLHLLNSFNPSSKGSEILCDELVNKDKIISLSGQGGKGLIRIKKIAILNNTNEIMQIMSILSKYAISIKQITFGIDEVAILVEKSHSIIDILADIRAKIDAESIEYLDNIALLSIVGNGLKYGTNSKQKVLNIIGELGEEIFTIYTSNDTPSIMFTMFDKNLDRTLVLLHQKLFE